MSKINKIRLSGTTYDIEDSGATKTVEVTQAQYDALVSGGTVDPNTFYVITDATAADLSQYWTSAQTQSAITEATSGKVDASTYETYTAATDTALNGKQDTLSAGTNITIVDNVISATGGGGGGTTYSAGTNISIDSANTINCTIPLSAGTGTGSIVGGDNESSSSGNYSFAFGHNADATASYAIAIGSNVSSTQQFSVHIGDGGSCGARMSFNYGSSNHNFANNTTIFGSNLSTTTNYETALGYYNKTLSGGSWTSGSTIFTIGNGYSFGSTNEKHNAFEVRGNGDIYVPNTDDTSVTGDYAYSLYPMVRLQDTITATAANTTALGGMKIVKLTESEYTALVTKDSNTLYVVVADPSN